MSKVNKNSFVIGQRGNIRALLGRREKPIHIEIQTLEQYIARQNYCWAQKTTYQFPLKIILQKCVSASEWISVCLMAVR